MKVRGCGGAHPAHVPWLLAPQWMHYTMLSWLPTYLVSTLEVDLSAAAQTALLPPLAGIAASACAGALGDSLLRAGVPTPWVRKVAQSIGFLAPTAFLLAATQVGGASALARAFQQSRAPQPSGAGPGG